MTSPVTPGVTPTWSHGGSGVQGWPPIAGNANGAGNPIALYNHGSMGINWPVLFLFPFSAAGGPQGSVSLTVFVESNPGPATGGVPDPNAWADESNGGFGMTNVVLSKVINPSVPFWRTRIASYVSGFLDSRLGPLQLANGLWVAAGYPIKPAGGPPDYSTGY